MFELRILETKKGRNLWHIVEPCGFCPLTEGAGGTAADASVSGDDRGVARRPRLLPGMAGRAAILKASI